VDNELPIDYTADQRTIPALGVQSLVWNKEKLVDWAGGNIEYELDGTKSGPRVNYPYRFDAVVVSPSGNFAVLFERLGTKSILLGPDGLFRELNRSYYHADVYEYPIHLFRLEDGREALAHCPEEFCHLQIEDPITGARLSDMTTGRLQSAFFSRISANAQGSRLLSACWVWHPADIVCVFNLKASHEGKIALEPCDGPYAQGAEVSSATFNAAGHLILTSAKGAEDFLDDESGERLRPGTIDVYDLDRQTRISVAPLEDEAGSLMPVGSDHVIGFFDHPKLIEIKTGRVRCRWPELQTGQQLSSILWHKPLSPPIALDPTSGRFAVADDKGITVVTLSTDLLK
jgi:hypothetical protein